jgi:DNA polymerase III sliding clamp (beta) subunit (PCNA family)
MRVATTCAALRAATSAAKAVCDPNAAVLAYTGVHLVATSDGSGDGGLGALAVEASDGDAAITASVDGADVAEPGSIVVAPEPLLRLLDASSGADPVELVTDGNDVAVRIAGGDPYRLRGLAVTFPTLLHVSLPGGPVDPERFATAVAAVRPAAGGAYEGVSLRSSPDGVRLAVTDGFRLHVAAIPGEGFGDFDGIVSVDVIDWAVRAKAHSIAVDSGGKLIAIRGAHATITARLLAPATPFPPIDNLLGGGWGHQCEADTAALKALLGRLAAVGVNVPVVVAGEAGSLTFTASQSDVGEGNERLEVGGDAAGVEFGADRGFFAAACGVHGPRATLGYNSATQPVTLTSQSRGVDVTTVLMPVRFD